MPSLDKLPSSQEPMDGMSLVNFNIDILRADLVCGLTKSRVSFTPDLVDDKRAISAIRRRPMSSSKETFSSSHPSCPNEDKALFANFLGIHRFLISCVLIQEISMSSPVPAVVPNEMPALPEGAGLFHMPYLSSRSGTPLMDENLGDSSSSVMDLPVTLFPSSVVTDSPPPSVTAPPVVTDSLLSSLTVTPAVTDSQPSSLTVTSAVTDCQPPSVTAPPVVTDSLLSSLTVTQAVTDSQSSSLSVTSAVTDCQPPKKKHCSFVKRVSSITSPSISYRALKLLRVGGMPQWQPARRSWDEPGSVTFQEGSLSLSWPPNGWKKQTPDQRLLAWEFACFRILASRGKTPTSRTEMLDSFNFLALPGTACHKISLSPIARGRNQNFLALKAISENKLKNIPYLSMLECASMMRDFSNDSLLKQCDKIPLRLTK